MNCNCKTCGIIHKKCHLNIFHYMSRWLQKDLLTMSCFLKQAQRVQIWSQWSIDSIRKERRQCIRQDLNIGTLKGKLVKLRIYRYGHVLHTDGNHIFLKALKIMLSVQWGDHAQCEETKWGWYKKRTWNERIQKTGKGFVIGWLSSQLEITCRWWWCLLPLN